MKRMIGGFSSVVTGHTPATDATWTRRHGPCALAGIRQVYTLYCREAQRRGQGRRLGSYYTLRECAVRLPPIHHPTNAACCLHCQLSISCEANTAASHSPALLLLLHCPKCTREQLSIAFLPSAAIHYSRHISRAEDYTTDITPAQGALDTIPIAAFTAGLIIITDNPPRRL